MREVTFASADRRSKLQIRPGSSADLIRLHFEYAASEIILHRASTRPAVCSRPAEDTPESNFEIFWRTFAEQYPFFGVRGVDWNAVYQEYRPQVKPSTTPDELFKTLSTMIAPFSDGHTSLRPKGLKTSYWGSRPDPNPLNEADRKKIFQIIERKYVRGRLRSFCNEMLSYGILGDSIGYLRIRAFAGYSHNKEFDQGTQALETALDDIFKDAERLAGLVVDVRINGGGSDLWGIAVASRLTDREYLAFAKDARKDIHDTSRFTERQPSWVRPSHRPHFWGPVVELVGINSVSAAETFTMALMGRRPQVIRIGEHTQGIFSDILGRTLPNGWNFGLPNERFLTEQGVAFDGPGIPPHIRVPVFPRSDLESGRDSGIEKAVEILKSSPNFSSPPRW